ncbi:Bestrophin, RFP-TM, chloride channel-domain-containing protein [Cladochytrium replicatum]|nr:Bestrophin, RFP-TM, chloride channel-domain-containing protein [Cladochytrium replicatum]
MASSRYEPTSRPFTPGGESLAPTVASSMKQSRKHNVISRHVANNKGYNWNELVAISGTVIPAVSLPVFAVTAFSTVVVVLNTYTSIFKGWLPNSTIMMTVLGVVLGLLLVFRTNTAYERFMEGRRLWGTVIVNLRNLSRLIWIGVHSKTDHLTPEEFNRKRCAMNLLMAFAAASKHYLRDEDEIDYEDLAPFISHISDFSYDRMLTFKADDGRVVPLDITHHLASYVAVCRVKDHIDINVQGLMNTAINSLVDCFTNFERVRNTPVPLAYSSLLKQIVMIYVVALPFQIVAQTSWVTIPIVFLGSFCLIGIESIGTEIENPFGYDANDLPMDQFCEDFRRETQALMSRTTRVACEEWGEAYAFTPVPEVYRAKTEEGCVTNATESIGGIGIPDKVDVLVKA